MSKPSIKKWKETIFSYFTGLKFIINGTFGINMLFYGILNLLLFFPLLIVEKQGYLTTFNFQVHIFVIPVFIYIGYLIYINDPLIKESKSKISLNSSVKFFILVITYLLLTKVLTHSLFPLYYKTNYYFDFQFFLLFFSTFIIFYYGLKEFFKKMYGKTIRNFVKLLFVALPIILYISLFNMYPNICYIPVEPNYINHMEEFFEKVLSRSLTFISLGFLLMLNALKLLNPKNF